VGEERRRIRNVLNAKKGRLGNYANGQESAESRIGESCAGWAVRVAGRFISGVNPV
jgi:hypothetical protein